MTNAARATVLKAITEADWMGWCRITAQTFGWRCYHTHDSRRSESGFPDLVLTRDGELLFVELKREGGKPTASQQAWLDDCMKVGGVEVYVWTPSMQDEVLERLRRKAAPTASQETP